MSRGPGRIERTIRAIFAAHPDEVFTTDDLCLACYPSLYPEKLPWLEQWQVERKHRVAVVRAADKVLATNPDWRRRPRHDRGGMAVFFNVASDRSMELAHDLHYGAASAPYFPIGLNVV